MDRARCGAARSKSTDLVGALRRCITVGVTRASAGRPFRPLSPANVGVTEYLLSVRASTLEGGRRVYRARICMLSDDLAASRRRHNGNDGAVRAKRYAKLRCAICPRDAPHKSTRSIRLPIPRALGDSLNSSPLRAWQLPTPRAICRTGSNANSSPTTRKRYLLYPVHT